MSEGNLGNSASSGSGGARGQAQGSGANSPSKGEAPIRPGITYGYTHADRLPGGRAQFEEKAPNAREAFDAMRKSGHDPVYERWQKQARDNQARDDRIHQKPVTKAEREAREKLRAKPKLEHTLEIDGSVKRAVDNRAHAENERRLNFINKRMRKVDGKARTHFDRSR